jgi:hypothetical protein
MGLYKIILWKEKELLAKIDAKRLEIDKAKAELRELIHEELMFSDENRQFEEKIESHPKAKFQRNPNPLDNQLVGRIHWIETLIDESNGKPFPIKRSQVVRVNGEWLV